MRGELHRGGKSKRWKSAKFDTSEKSQEIDRLKALLQKRKRSGKNEGRKSKSKKSNFSSSAWRLYDKKVKDLFSKRKRETGKEIQAKRIGSC